MNHTQIARYLDFFEKLVGHIAWPIVFLVVFRFFRDEIKSIISRIRSAEIKDLRLEINDKVDEIKKEAVNAGVTMFYPEDLIKREFDQQNEKSRETQIIDAWKRIENLVLDLDQRVDKTNRLNDSISYLLKLGTIEKYLGNLIISLKDLRNVVVHTEDVKVTDEEFQNWISISKSVIDRLQSKLRSKGTYH